MDSDELLLLQAFEDADRPPAPSGSLNLQTVSVAMLDLRQLRSHEKTVCEQSQQKVTNVSTSTPITAQPKLSTCRASTTHAVSESAPFTTEQPEAQQGQGQRDESGERAEDAVHESPHERDEQQGANPPSISMPGSKPAVSPTATALTIQEQAGGGTSIPDHAGPTPPHPRRVRHADSIHLRERQSRTPIATLDGRSGTSTAVWDECERWLLRSSSAASTRSGALLTFWYFSAPETGVAFFPPAGLTLATLLLTPRRTWPLWLAAVAVAEIWIDLAHGQTLFMAVGFATANVAEPLVGASLFLIGMKRQGIAPRRDLARYVVCAVAVGPFDRRHDRRLGRRDRRQREPSRRRRPSGGSATRSACSWSRLPCSRGSAATSTRPRPGFPRRSASPCSRSPLTVIPAIHFDGSFTYMVAGVLMLAALRGGPFGVGVSGFAVGFAASWVVATGHAHALLTVVAPHDALVDTQLFIGVTILVALTLAVEVVERTRAEHALAGAETARIRAEFEASRSRRGRAEPDRARDARHRRARTQRDDPLGGRRPSSSRHRRSRGEAVAGDRRGGRPRCFS